MQASDKEALPLFGTLGRKEGGKGSIATLRESPPLPVLDFRSWSQPAWESVEHQGRPSDAPSLTKTPKDKGPRK